MSKFSEISLISCDAPSSNILDSVDFNDDSQWTVNREAETMTRLDTDS